MHFGHHGGEAVPRQGREEGGGREVDAVFLPDHRVVAEIQALAAIRHFEHQVAARLHQRRQPLREAREVLGVLVDMAGDDQVERTLCRGDGAAPLRRQRLRHRFDIGERRDDAEIALQVQPVAVPSAAAQPVEQRVVLRGDAERADAVPCGQPVELQQASGDRVQMLLGLAERHPVEERADLLGRCRFAELQQSALPAFQQRQRKARHRILRGLQQSGRERMRADVEVGRQLARIAQLAARERRRHLNSTEMYLSTGIFCTEER
jgi:hypothetical protein